ncbi:protein-arginine omega-N symmetric methyltransferase [Malassezia pachydermatis]
MKTRGPLTIPAYMQACLTNPDYGYYASKSNADTTGILGAGGDFITSPEISQVFGELMAIFFISRWQSAGQPSRVRLVELGPGRGTLLSDMLRTFAAFPDMLAALRSIELVEASPLFIERQEAMLNETLGKFGRSLANADTPIDALAEHEIRVEWFASYDQVPVQPDAWTIVMAHEFFDALPIHIFEKQLDGWREVMVDIDEAKRPVTVIKASDLGKSDQDKEPELRFVLSPGATPWSQLLAANSERFKALQPGQRVEVSPISWAAARRFGELVSGYPALRPTTNGETEAPSADVAAQRTKPSMGGCGLMIDYGANHFFSHSFRAFRAHKIVDPLSLPGQSDLTANVDFSFLAQAVGTTDSLSYGPMPQREFLTALGLSLRVKKLLESNPPARAKVIEQAAARLIDAHGMGKQYQVLGVSAPAQASAGANEPEEVYPFM